MSQQSLQNWMVHLWLRQPRPWTHTRQETRRKVSIQLLGPLSLSHSAELIMYLQYTPLCVCVCVCVCAHVRGCAIILLILLKAGHACEGLTHPVSSSLTESPLCPLYKNVKHMSVSTGSYTVEQETKCGQRQHGNREMYQDLFYILFNTLVDFILCCLHYYFSFLSILWRKPSIPQNYWIKRTIIQYSGHFYYFQAFFLSQEERLFLRYFQICDLFYWSGAFSAPSH